jgi:kinesin family protein 1
VTKQKIYFVQTPNEKELYDWLYAINPLLAGQIRSATAHNRPKVSRSPGRKSTSSTGGAQASDSLTNPNVGIAVPHLSLDQANTQTSGLSDK